METRTTPCGREISANVKYHEHEGRCTTCMEVKLKELELQIQELTKARAEASLMYLDANRLNGEYRKVLEDIAGRSCCDEVCFGPCASKRAKGALAERPNHEPDGLKLGESRGLPYPKPISNDAVASGPLDRENTEKRIVSRTNLERYLAVSMQMLMARADRRNEDSYLDQLDKLHEPLTEDEKEFLKEMGKDWATR